jgi:hypothetical protein
MVLQRQSVHSAWQRPVSPTSLCEVANGRLFCLLTTTIHGIYANLSPSEPAEDDKRRLYDDGWHCRQESGSDSLA